MSLDIPICEKHRIPVALCKVCSNAKFTEKQFTRSEVEALLDKQVDDCIAAYITCNKNAGCNPINRIRNSKLNLNEIEAGE